MSNTAAWPSATLSELGEAYSSSNPNAGLSLVRCMKINGMPLPPSVFLDGQNT
jgi:hypothetical protein